MRGQLIAHRARRPSELATRTAIEVALFKALERAWSDPPPSNSSTFSRAVTPVTARVRVLTGPTQKEE
jgi:hypothetical protein